MKKILKLTALLSLTSFFAAAQDTKSPMDSSSKKTALAICNCLSKQDLDKVTNEEKMQQVFIKCMLDSAAEAFSEVLQKEDTKAAGEELGKKVAMDLVSIGCSSFINLAVKAAKANGQSGVAASEEAKTMEGTVINVEEKDFLYVTIKSKTNREYRFIYLTYVPASDSWIKNATKLNGKKVQIQWSETEVFQPKAKIFTQLKQIKSLKLL